jgi:transcriptional regulator with XRE-family HTH domain
MSESQDILKEEFHEEEYRHAYAEDFLNTKIATQIRVLREQRGWTQADLADKIGTKQAGVSRLENVNYSGWKIETLKRIARAFDVIFNAGFESFGNLLDEAEKFSRASLEKPSFDDDPAFHGRVAASAAVHSSPDASSALASILEAPAQLPRSVLPLGAAQQQASRDQAENHFLGSAACASVINFDDERRKRGSAGMAIYDGQRHASGNSSQRLMTIKPAATR